MVFAGFLALTILDSAQKGFELLFLSGAGTGAIYLLRWFWWRINAMTEIVAMIVATLAAVWLVFGPGDDGALRWFISSGSVSEKVHRIEDPALLSFIEAAKTEGGKTLESLDQQVVEAAAAWKAANKKDEAARIVAHRAYATTYTRQTEVKNSLSVGALTEAFVRIKAPDAILKVDPAPANPDAPAPDPEDLAAAAETASIIDSITQAAAETSAVKAVTAAPAWPTSLEKFKMGFREKLLGTINSTLESRDKPSKGLYAANIGFGGIVKDGIVYIHHPEVSGLTFSVKLMFMVILVTLSWIIGTLLSKPVAKETLYAFYRQCHPGGPGWAKVLRNAKDEGVDLNGSEDVDWQMPLKLLCVFIGTVMIYSCLFSIGNFVYGNTVAAWVLAAVAVGSCFALFAMLNKIRTD